MNTPTKEVAFSTYDEAVAFISAVLEDVVNSNRAAFEKLDYAALDCLGEDTGHIGMQLFGELRKGKTQQ